MLLTVFKQIQGAGGEGHLQKAVIGQFIQLEKMENKKSINSNAG